MGMNSTRKYRTGFLPFGTDDDGVLVQADLKSASGLDGATATVAGYDSTLGVQISTAYNDGNSLSWPATMGQLANGGQMTFLVDQGAFDSSTLPAVNTFLSYFSGASNVQFRQNAGTYVLANAGLIGNSYLSSIWGAGAQIRVDLSWNRHGIMMFKDYVPVIAAPWNAPPAFDGRLYLSGEGGSGGVNNYTGWFSNLQIVDHPIIRPVHSKAVKITVLGDSFTKMGQYPLSNMYKLGYQSDPLGDGTFTPVNTFMDNGMLPGIQRVLAQAGIFVGDDQIYWHGRGGCRVASVTAAGTNVLSARTDSMLANTGTTTYPIPGERDTTQVVVCNVGTDDLGGTPTTTTDFQNYYQAEITRWVNAGADSIILVNVAQRYDVDALSSIQAYNAIIDGLAASNAKVKSVVDFFTPTYTDRSLINTTDNVHPSGLGQALLGTLCGNAVLGAVLSS